MQNAKDTFYNVLRSRLAALNPDRTIVLRGVVRPGVLVDENELVSSIDTPDCFHIAWPQQSVDASGTLPTVTMPCEITYETAGTAFNAGMDRGRLLAAMDGELLAAVNASPQNALKMNYTRLPTGGSATDMTTSIWWGNVAFEPAIVKGDRLARTARVGVFSYQEAGEL